MSDSRPDVITAGLAVSYGALALVIDALIAAGALVALVLDLLAPAKTPPFAAAATPIPAAPPPVAAPGPLQPPPAAVAVVLATGLPLHCHSAAQLRQLARHTGLPRWWSADRKTCLTALGALA
jgi:hypothetical protein